MNPPNSAPERLRASLAHKAPAKPAKAVAPRESVAQSVKASYSLFPADHDRIEAIRKALAGKGRKISASHAIRLALRATEIDADKLETLLGTMQSEDGRTRRHAKSEM